MTKETSSWRGEQTILRLVVSGITTMRRADGMKTETGSHRLFMTANTGAIFLNFPIWMVSKMADVLIKGMEMPSECEFCPMCDDIGGLGCRVNHLVILRRHGQARPSWCPLAELEPVYKKDGRRYIFAMWAEVPKHYPMDGEQDA